MDRHGLKALVAPDSRMFVMARQGVRRPHLILSTIMLLLLTVVGFLAALVPERLLFGDVEEASAMSHIIYQWTVPFVMMTVLLWVWIALYEKRPLRTLGFVGGKPLKKYFAGAIAGFAMITFAVGLIAAAGGVQFEEGGSLPSGVHAIRAVALLLLAFAVQTAGEEVLVRGWYLPVIGARHGPWVGVVASSLVFAAFHGFTNPLATVNLGLFGLFLALYCLYEGSIWGVCGWHAAWNWGQVNVFGLHVSGYPPDGGVLIDLQARGSQFLSGGSYGPEGSIMGTVSLLAGIAVVVLLANRKAGKSAAT